MSGVFRNLVSRDRDKKEFFFYDKFVPFLPACDIDYQLSPDIEFIGFSLFAGDNSSNRVVFFDSGSKKRQVYSTTDGGLNISGQTSIYHQINDNLTGWSVVKGANNLGKTVYVTGLNKLVYSDSEGEYNELGLSKIKQTYDIIYSNLFGKYYITGSDYTLSGTPTSYSAVTYSLPASVNITTLSGGTIVGSHAPTGSNAINGFGLVEDSTKIHYFYLDQLNDDLMVSSSIDGINFTSQTTNLQEFGSGNFYKKCVYSPTLNRYILTYRTNSNLDRIYYSNVGSITNWNLSTTDFGGSAGVHTLIWVSDFSKFYLACENGVYYSSDGISWSFVNNLPNGNGTWSSITYDDINNRLYATTWNPTKFWYSTDGLNFSLSNQYFPDPPTSLTITNSPFSVNGTYMNQTQNDYLYELDNITGDVDIVCNSGFKYGYLLKSGSPNQYMVYFDIPLSLTLDNYKVVSSSPDISITCSNTGNGSVLHNQTFDKVIMCNDGYIYPIGTQSNSAVVTWN